MAAKGRGPSIDVGSSLSRGGPVTADHREQDAIVSSGSRQGRSEQEMAVEDQRAVGPIWEAERGGSTDPLERLWDEYSRFEFFQAVRLLETHHVGSPRLGHRGPARLERIRLRPSASLGFPASEIANVRHIAEKHGLPSRTELETHFLGLVGSGTPLPLSYANEIQLEDDAHPEIRGFLDMFHHRMLSLLYRAWLRARPQLDRGGDRLDRLARLFLDMLGVPPDATKEALGTEPIRLLRYAGLLLLPSRPPGGLEILLSGELGLPIRVQQLVPRWVNLSPQQMFRLFESQGSKGVLGQNIVIGARIPDRSGRIRLVIGPTTCERLGLLSPEAEDGIRLGALTRFYLRQPLGVDVQVLVPADEFPSPVLGGSTPAQMGRMRCIGPPREDPVAIMFELETPALDL